MSTKWVALIFFSLSAFITGGLLYALYYNIVIIRWPSSSSQAVTTSTSVIPKKLIILFFFKNNRWYQEEKQLIWPDNKYIQIMHILINWLIVLDEEEVTHKKISLQTALLSPSENDVYISFDRNPFSKESSTYEKMMLVESLLKTIRENKINIQNIYFLVHHIPLNDYHLDFSQPWPITGYISSDIK